LILDASCYLYKAKLHLYYESFILPTDVEAPLFVKQSNINNKQVVHNALPVKKKDITFPSEECYKNSWLWLMIMSCMWMIIMCCVDHTGNMAA
jgi:hypothetical protein